MWKWLCFFAIIAGAIVSAAYKQHCARERYQAQSKADCVALSVSIEEKRSCAKDARSRKEYAPWWYVLVTWPEGITTWAIIGTGAIIGWQSSEVRRATNSQRSKDRARLSVEPLYEGCVDFDDPDTIIPNTLSETGVKITQHGPTKAFNVKGRAAVTFESSEEGKRLRPKRIAPLHIPSVIDGDPASIDAKMAHFGITSDKLETVWAKQSFIHFFGQITYDDVFGESHQISFRYIWKPKILVVPGEPGKRFVSGEGGWEPNGKKKDNYAD